MVGLNNYGDSEVNKESIIKQAMFESLWGGIGEIEKAEDIPNDLPIDGMGASSLDAVEIIMSVENELSICIDEYAINNFPNYTVDDVAEVIE